MSAAILIGWLLLSIGFALGWMACALFTVSKRDDAGAGETHNG